MTAVTSYYARCHRSIIISLSSIDLYMFLALQLRYSFLSNLSDYGSCCCFAILATMLSEAFCQDIPIWRMLNSTPKALCNPYVTNLRRCGHEVVNVHVGTALLMMQLNRAA